jgi:hypothetical protein
MRQVHNHPSLGSKQGHIFDFIESLRDDNELIDSPFAGLAYQSNVRLADTSFLGFA